jgi:hypothetical protein
MFYVSPITKLERETNKAWHKFHLDEFKRLDKRERVTNETTKQMKAVK